MFERFFLLNLLGEGNLHNSLALFELLNFSERSFKTLSSLLVHRNSCRLHTLILLVALSVAKCGFGVP